MAERRLMKTLHHIRHEKYEVVDYLGEVLKSFKDFVQRPDPKQEYVSQWQIDFNRYIFGISWAADPCRLDHIIWSRIETLEKGRSLVVK